MSTGESIINYGALLNEAIHGVVREALKYAESDYVPPPHAFYITFLTEFRGVKISDALKRKFPEDLTIVLQHEFRNLVVEGDQFSVTLSFDDKEERLCVPYNAILRFADPSSEIELTFTPIYDEQEEAGLVHHMKHSKDSITVKQQDNVISLADFKKK
jgi:hypothetical protein